MPVPLRALKRAAWAVGACNGYARYKEFPCIILRSELVMSRCRSIRTLPSERNHDMAIKQPQTSAAARPGNGFAVTALVLGLVGIPFGLIPITGLFAVAAGLVGLVLGLLAIGQALRGRRRRKVMAWAGTVLSAVALALGVWGMTIVDKAVKDINESVSAIEQSDPSGAAAPAASSQENSVKTAKFGESISFENGTSVTVSAPRVREFGPSSTISGQKGVVVEVAVTAGNETVTGATVMVNARQGQSEVPAVYDENVDGSIANDIRPGRTVKETYAFSADNADNFEVIVKPGFDYNEAVFTDS